MNEYVENDDEVKQVINAGELLQLQFDEVSSLSDKAKAELLSDHVAQFRTANGGIEMILSSHIAKVPDLYVRKYGSLVNAL